ncbi:hypothetical protein DR046_10290 [Jannaschia formosa]|nr:hypothetical protein DR046_10290 [Jannaschia formosa]
MVCTVTMFVVAVSTGGPRRSVGLHAGPSKVEPIWTDGLRSLVKRYLSGNSLAISDAHDGLNSAITPTMAWAASRTWPSPLLNGPRESRTP